MHQNKIFYNYFVEIIKTFLLILFGLSLIALTVRAVNFLDLIVENGYPTSIYFLYSFLNLFGLAPKFIPLSFLIAIFLFIYKHLENSEFLILWTSGVKKIKLVNLFFISSLFVLIFYLIFSIFLTPAMMNKSRQLLAKDEFNSILPTLKTNEFSNSFKNLIFFVEKKFENKIENIFVQDNGNYLRKFTPDVSNDKVTNIIAKSGIVKKKELFLVDGQIISFNKTNNKNNIIKFDQISINLTDINTTQIKQPKIQETSTHVLLGCVVKSNFNNKFCNNESKKEIVPNLNRRLSLPLYIPVIALLCSLLILKSKKKYFNKSYIFFYSFSLLVMIELSIKYTGINYLTQIIFIFLPFILIAFLYLFLNRAFLKEFKTT
jgi:lipopolysaccharide export LptBFGC system permease protein LptF